jgi:hypothetical protein
MELIHDYSIIKYLVILCYLDSWRKLSSDEKEKAYPQLNCEAIGEWVAEQKERIAPRNIDKQAVGGVDAEAVDEREAIKKRKAEKKSRMAGSVKPTSGNLSN